MINYFGNNLAFKSNILQRHFIYTLLHLTFILKYNKLCFENGWNFQKCFLQGMTHSKTADHGKCAILEQSLNVKCCGFEALYELESTLEEALASADFSGQLSTSDLDKYADFIVTAVDKAILKSKSMRPESNPI